MEEICIIGGGATSVAFIVSLAESVIVNRWHCPNITLISGDKQPGPGIAFRKSHHLHKLNTPNSLMSIFPSHNGDFSIWMKKKENLENRNKEQNVELYEDYITRSTYGEYLIERLTWAINFLRSKGIKFNIILNPATDVRLNGSKLELRTENSPWIFPRWIVYAPGHPGISNFPDMHSSPFFATNLPVDKTLIYGQKINKVAVLGTGLTAIDAVMQLLGDGFTGQIDCYSRKALLPTVQSRMMQQNVIPEHISYENIIKYKYQNGNISIYDIIKLLLFDLKKYSNNEYFLAKKINPSIHQAKFLEHLLKKGDRGYLPLQALLQSTRSYAHKIWYILDDIERIKFLKHYQRLWDVWRHSIPWNTANIILKALNYNKLTVNNFIRFENNNDGIYILSTYGKILYQFVIDGTGGHNIVEKTSDPFLSKALQIGLFKSSRYGGLSVDVRSLKSEVTPPILTETFLLGQIAKGDLFSTNALWFNKICAEKVAETILRQFAMMSNIS